MAGPSPIEWTERTWNPVVGCAIHSPGCAHCYAMPMAARLERMGVAHYAGLTQPSKAGPVWTGEFRAAPNHVLTEPLRRKKPATYFVNSMSDLFGEGVPDALIDQVFAIMALCPQHTLQVLTKRSGRMRAFLNDPAARRRIARAAVDLFLDGHFQPDQPCAFEPVQDEGVKDFTLYDWPLPNVWLGVSAEDQARADERIPDLLATPAAVRFVSLEPLLGPIDLTRVQAPRFTPEDAEMDWRFDALAIGDTYEFQDSLGVWESGDGPYREHRLDQVIVGGESGPKARPIHPDWVRSLRDQCVADGVPFFFKQWGCWTPGENAGPITGPQTGARRFDDRWVFEEFTQRGAEELTAYDEPDVWRVGKKAAGRLLDGRTWDQRPEVAR